MIRGGKTEEKSWQNYVFIVLCVIVAAIVSGLITSSLLNLTERYQQLIIIYVYIGLLMLAVLLYGNLIVARRLRRRLSHLEISAVRMKARADQAHNLENQVRQLEKQLKDSDSRHKINEKHLKSLDSTKDDFISMASHQLRTPLTSVKGYLSLVLDGDAGKINDQQRKMLGQAFISGQRMVYMIADLLNVSRLQTGKFFIPANISRNIGRRQYGHNIQEFCIH